MGIRKSQSPRPDQLWPEGVPHPTSPPPPRARDPHGAKSEIIREAKAALAEAFDSPPVFRSGEQWREFYASLRKRWESETCFLLKHRIANDPSMDRQAIIDLLDSLSEPATPAPESTTPQP